MGTVHKQSVFRRFLFPIVSLFVLLAAGTAGYWWLENIDTINALYMTVITISTVGFGEIKPLSPLGRLFTICLIFGGGGLVAYTLTSVATFLFSGDWRLSWEQKRRFRMLSQLSDHIIVCGYGRVGRHVAGELRAEGLQFVVIDPDPEKITQINIEDRAGEVDTFWLYVAEH